MTSKLSMPEAAKPLDILQSLDEQQRACTYFRAVLSVHSAAIQAFRVLPTLPESDGIVATVLRLKDGLKSSDGEAYLRYARQISATMADERDRGYKVIRGSALVAVCAAFEYVIKATFVSQAAYDPRAAAELLRTTKLRIRASDVLGMPETEQWFAIADQLFDQLAETDPAMHKRVRRFLLEFTYLPGRNTDLTAMTKALDGLQVGGTFDEAFLTRNCLVHNGGRVTAVLARISGQPVGALIVFKDGALSPMFKPMDELVGILSALWV